MRPSSVFGALSTVLFVSFAPSLSAQSGAFATRVVAFDTNNGAGGGIFAPNNALGAPGSSSMAVHSLGVGGFLTLGFSVVITDGPGDDIIVFENPFASGGLVYSEAMFVEVSTNGTDFARFPNRYQGPSTSGGAFALNLPGYYEGLAGIKPHRGGQAGVDVFDVVQAGGDSFDLSDLKNHPLVVSGKVDLKQIHQVRLVDVEAGVSRDSSGRIIEDPTSGSADVNAVAVIHHTGNLRANGPTVALEVPSNGNLTLTISDPNGISDINPQSLRMSLDGVEFPPQLLIFAMQVQSASMNQVTLRLGSTVPPSFLFHLSVSLRDLAGSRSGQNRVR